MCILCLHGCNVLFGLTRFTQDLPEGGGHNYFGAKSELRDGQVFGQGAFFACLGGGWLQHPIGAFSGLFIFRVGDSNPRTRDWVTAGAVRIDRGLGLYVYGNAASFAGNTATVGGKKEQLSSGAVENAGVIRATFITDLVSPTEGLADVFVSDVYSYKGVVWNSSVAQGMLYRVFLSLPCFALERSVCPVRSLRNDRCYPYRSKCRLQMSFKRRFSSVSSRCTSCSTVSGSTSSDRKQGRRSLISGQRRVHWERAEA